MSNLSNQQINSSFSGLLQIPGGITNSLQTVQDGNGNSTGLMISTTGINAVTASSFVASFNGSPYSGAVNRLINDGFGDVFSVKDFGAKGDGVTDDTAAIQSAINAATQSTSSGIVFFPPNSTSQYYKVTSPLVCTKPVSLQGSGEYATTIIGVGFSSGEYILKLDNAVSSAYYYKVNGLTIRSLSGTPNGILIKNCSMSDFSNINLFNVYKGIVVTGTTCFTNNFYRVSTYNVINVGILYESFTGGGQHKFDGCTFNADTGFSLNSSSTTDGVVFINCNFEQCGTNELYVGGTINGLSIIGCRTEGLNSGVEFLIRPEPGNSVGGLSITGCSFTADGGAVIPISLGGSGGFVRGFNITGNRCNYVANPYFVYLNGDGESGIISGNYTQFSTSIVNVLRPNVVVIANEYSTAGGGKNAESWGQALWAVVQDNWTPIDSSGAGLTLSGAGIYQQIGNMVYFQGVVTYPTTSDVSNSIIGGLPKTIYSGSSQVGRSGAYVSTSTSSNAVGLLLLTATNTVSVRKANSVNATNADLSGATIYFAGMYRIA